MRELDKQFFEWDQSDETSRELKSLMDAFCEALGFEDQRDVLEDMIEVIPNDLETHRHTHLVVRSIIAHLSIENSELNRYILLVLYCIADDFRNRVLQSEMRRSRSDALLMEAFATGLRWYMRLHADQLAPVVTAGLLTLFPEFVSQYEAMLIEGIEREPDESMKASLIHEAGRIAGFLTDWRMVLSRLGNDARLTVRFAWAVEALHLDGKACDPRALEVISSCPQDHWTLKLHLWAARAFRSFDKASKCECFVKLLINAKTSIQAISLVALFLREACAGNAKLTNVSPSTGPNRLNLYAIHLFPRREPPVLQLTNADLEWLSIMPSVSLLRIDDLTKQPLQTNLLSLFGIEVSWQKLLDEIAAGRIHQHLKIMS